MGLMEQEITELRTMNKRVMAGTIKPEEVNMRIAIYSQVEKRTKMMLQAFAMQAKYGRKSTGGLFGSNLIGDGVTIDLGIEADIEKGGLPGS